MSLYFRLSQVPELAGLTRRQRKQVYGCALEAFYCEDTSRVLQGAPWIFGGTLAGALAGWMVVAGIGLSHLKLIVAAGGLVGAMIGVFIGTQIQTAQLRPYLRRVLEERKDEIAKMN